MKSEIRDGMKIDWDAPIEMDDGVVLRADVFRPVADGKYPVIMSYGPYAKGLSMQEGYKSQWMRIVKAAPDVLEGSSNKHQNWELFDPEKWVPDGYICVRVDSRGAGRSPGYLETWSPREAKDIAACVDWAGVQPWSNGKVGLHGISYYSMNQWQAAPLKPKHLAALCIWEGSSDYYRELCRHGGILSDFYSSWYPRQVTAVQHGVGERGARSVVTGEPVAGPLNLTDDELKKNRADCDGDALRHRLIDDYHKARLPKFEDIETPLFSAANWGGMGLHPRGNFEGFLRAGSKQKWLEVHGDTHFTLFYAKYGQDLQRQFFDRFLKGIDNGWEKRPKVLLQVRHPGEKFVARAENEWPLARTQWTKFYLHPDRELDLAPPEDAATLTYATSSDGVTLLDRADDRGDGDHRPGRGQAVRVVGHHRRRPVPGAAGVRSARQGGHVHRLERSARAGRPRLAPRLAPQARSEGDASPTGPITPTTRNSRSSPASRSSSTSRSGRPRSWCRRAIALALSVRGKDYEVDGTDAALPHAPYPMKGVGPFTHTNPLDRPPAIFGGKNTLHFGGKFAPYVLLPIIPKSA